MDSEKPLYYCRSLDGHRREYLNFIKKLFGGGRVDGLEIFYSSRPVFFLMIEEAFVLYFAVAIWRSLFGLRTAGLLFRPKPTVEGKNFKLRIKRKLLIVLRCIGSVRTLAIVPVSLDPRFFEIVDDWIYDFQIWDISESEKAKFEKLRAGIFSQEQYGEDKASIVREVRDSAGSRKVIAAIGRQDYSKGFDKFSDFCIQGDVVLNWHSVVGGKVATNCENYASALTATGGTVVNRFVSDEEVIALYAVSDVIWCAYSEDYDQASGIMGRAVQLGLPVIVRNGSISHQFCVLENINHIPFDNNKKLAADILISNKINVEKYNEITNRFRLISLDKLANALGVSCVSTK